MWKAIISIVGLLLLIVSLQLATRLKSARSEALALDDEQIRYGLIGEDEPPLCGWEVALADRVMAENTSQSVAVTTTNPSDKACQTILSLRAPGFEMSPAKEDQTVTLPVGGSGSVSWIVSPRKTGTYEIAVSDVLNTKVLGLTVTNVFGLSAQQAKLLSMVGGLFGPMLTVPWWMEKWLQRRQKNKNRPEDEDRITS